MKIAIKGGSAFIAPIHISRGGKGDIAFTADADKNTFCEEI